jgi:quercetin dioxygenase-like cupin family protein
MLGMTMVAIHLEGAASAQAANAVNFPRGCDTPVSERKVEAGCYTTAESILGVLPSGPLFWHLDEFPSREMAEMARGPRGTVTESFGKHWLFTIAEEGWRGATGQRVASIGPLVVASDKPYTARYMEALFPPGSQPVGRAPGHRHPGPEAWYVLTGAQCLETPNGIITATAGGTMLVPEGWPMAIADLGTEIRRTVLLVLHPSSEPYAASIDDPNHPGAPHSHWQARGLCPK